MPLSQTQLDLIKNNVSSYNNKNPNKPQVDFNIVVNMATVESNGNSNATSPKGARGLMQIMPSNYASLNITNPNDDAQSVRGGVQLFGQLLQQYHGDVKLALAAYNAGTVATNKYRDGTGTLPTETVNYIAKVTGENVPVNSNGGGVPESPAITRTAGAYVNLVNRDVDEATFESLAASDVIVRDGEGTAIGLDEVPWYWPVSGLLTGNPRVRNEVSPVVFQVMLHDTEDFTMTSDGKGTGWPIDIQLNASMKEYNITSKHIIHPQRSRTGYHLYLWGMQADMIEGRCTTGVFMNQFGLTDFFSTSVVNDDLKKLVTGGYVFTNQEGASYPDTSSESVTTAGGVTGGGVNVYNTMKYDYTNNDWFSRIVQKYSPDDPSVAFRVAAQDAFVEFLSLFKNNGIVWFSNQNYGLGETRDQSAVQAYSPRLGLSTAQVAARNNDVMSRGSVLMKFKNITYMGYFKTLQWTMDARNPYQWEFSFVFQVEKTLGLYFNPWK